MDFDHLMTFYFLKVIIYDHFYYNYSLLINKKMIYSTIYLIIVNLK